MLMKKFKILLYMLMLTSVSIFAQEFTSSVDKTTVGENETFQVYFTFKGKDNNGLRNFSPPAFSGFRVLSGPNQSTSMQYINGAMSSSITYSYYLQAAQQGKFKIDAASVEYEGKTLKTDPINITSCKRGCSSTAGKY